MILFPFVMLIGGAAGLVGSHRRILNALLSFEIIILGLLGCLGL